MWTGGAARANSQIIHLKLYVLRYNKENSLILRDALFLVQN